MKAAVSGTLVQLPLSVEYVSYALRKSKSGGGTAGLDHELAHEKAWMQKRVLLVTMTRSRGRRHVTGGRFLGELATGIISGWVSGLGCGGSTGKGDLPRANAEIGKRWGWGEGR